LDLYLGSVSFVRMVALAAGVAVVFVGIARGAGVARGGGGRARAAREMGSHAALGLEFFVGATLLHFVIDPSLAAAAMAALTIAVRKLLTYAVGLATRGSRDAATGS
jgi:uncharacterized membrane protein